MPSFCHETILISLEFEQLRVQFALWCQILQPISIGKQGTLTSRVKQIERIAQF